LPVLEAMSCGAPVIASNNSSIPEVVGRSDAMFDVSEDKDVIATLYKALTNDAFLIDLSTFSLKRAKQFSWEKTAQCAWDSISAIEFEKKNAGKQVFSIPARESRPCIAYVSPLPPNVSGIADYSAALLPYLAVYFDIDLFTEPGTKVSDTFIRENFHIYPWTELLNRRDIYETVIYHIGNSEFHTYMVDLLQEFPGIVVTHDFYLSNIPFVSEFVQGNQNIFFEEIEDSHGLCGLIELIKYGVDTVRMNLPINWRILRNAQELVCHSGHQIELIENFYSHGWKPNPTIIRQLREIAPEIPHSKRIALRNELGIDPNAFVFCSFGLMAPTKLNNPTIQAFSQLLATTHENAILIFVGPLPGGEYGEQTSNLIKELKLQDRVLLTGYSEKDDYEKYLGCADAAIQLRQSSRGETSRAVLDCMAYGLPIIINSHGSLNEYDNDDMVKLRESPNICEIAEAMKHIIVDEQFRIEKGLRSIKTIFEKHHPEKIALSYAEVIQRAIQGDERKIFSHFVDVLDDLDAAKDMLFKAAKYASANSELRCQPRILVDATGFQDLEAVKLYQPDFLEMIEGLFSTNNRSIHIELVQTKGEQILRASRLVETIFKLPEKSLQSNTPITILPGDVLLVHEYNWSAYDPGSEIIEKIKQKGGKVIAAINRLPENELPAQLFDSDAFICRSLEVAQYVATCCKGLLGGHQHLEIYYTATRWDKLAAWMLGNISEVQEVSILFYK
jgi:glycosyltransferase involved in cell wall biosynthesis